MKFFFKRNNKTSNQSDCNHLCRHVVKKICNLDSWSIFEVKLLEDVYRFPHNTNIPLIDTPHTHARKYKFILFCISMVFTLRFFSWIIILYFNSYVFFSLLKKLYISACDLCLNVKFFFFTTTIHFLLLLWSLLKHILKQTKNKRKK